MKPKLRLIIQLLLVAAVAALSCWVTGRLLSPRDDHHVASGHYSIHDKLDLTAAQEKALEAIEERYAEQWKALASEIERANLDLAQSLRRDEGWSPEAAAAVATITRAQGELQKVTLEHVFAMEPHLEPGQYQRLLELCAESLERPQPSPREH